MKISIFSLEAEPRSQSFEVKATTKQKAKQKAINMFYKINGDVKITSIAVSDR